MCVKCLYHFCSPKYKMSGKLWASTVHLYESAGTKRMWDQIVVKVYTAIWLCSNRLFNLYNLSLLSWFVGSLDETWFINPCNPSPMPKRLILSQRKETKTWRESVLWQNWSNSKPHASSVNLWLHWCIEEDYLSCWRKLTFSAFHFSSIKGCGDYPA